MLSLGLAASLATADVARDAELVAAVAAQCAAPVTLDITVPNGATSTTAEMAMAGNRLRARDAEATAYARCIKAAGNRWLEDPAIDATRRSQVAATVRELVDEAITPVERLAADYNRQLRCFRSRGSAAADCEPEPIVDGGGTANKAASPIARQPSLATERDTVSGYIIACGPDGRAEGRIVVEVEVGVNGRATLIGLPEGSAPWLRQVADCIVRELAFNPAQLADGTPVSARIRMPIKWGGQFAGLQPVPIRNPRLDSSPVEIETALRACRDQELAAADVHGEVVYRIEVTSRGTVRPRKPVRSSGDERVDRIAGCTLRRLRFEPARREGQAIETGFALTVRVRPPGVAAAPVIDLPGMAGPPVAAPSAAN